MLNRLLFVVAIATAIALLPRTYLTIHTAASIFPILKDEVVVFDVPFGPSVRAAFIAAHAFAAWFVWIIWRGKVTLAVKLLTLILFVELLAIYVITLLLKSNGVYITLY